jgi:hypothetical protein
VVYLRVPGLGAADVADAKARRRWIREVEARVATGLGSKRPELAPRVDSRRLPEIMRYGAKAIGVPAELCERQYIPIPDDVDPLSIELGGCWKFNTF